jgi:L-fuculose-phosphate aldolase
MTTLVESLITSGRRLADSGITPGTSGNLSARSGDRVTMTATNTDLGALDSHSFTELALDGEVFPGPKPSKEAAIHLAMYSRNPGHSAVVHVHSPFAIALSCLEPWSDSSAIPPITPYFVMRVGQTPLIPYRAPGDPSLGELIRSRHGEFSAVLLANHGQVVSGVDLDSALAAAVELEEACRTTILTNGMPRRLLDNAQAAELAARYGTAWTPSLG